MSANLGGFNAEDVEPQKSFEPVPPGWYTTMITNSEMKATKDGTGEYLQLRLDIIDGEYEGRVLFDRLNLVNENQTAVDIAQRQLSAICHVVGVLQPQNSDELHDKPLRVKVAIRPPSNGYDASNEVKAYAEAGNAGKQAAPAQPASGGGNGGSSKKKPWE